MAANPVAICHRCPHRGPLVGRSIACTVNGRDIIANAAAWDCPKGLYPARGLGDAVAKAIHAVTLGMVRPCRPCKERRDLLNRVVPFYH
jgi:hypothetical protein